MALTPEQDLLEHELRIEQMRTAIENGRLNMKKLEADLRLDTWRIVLQAMVGFAAALGAGVALANYVNSRPALPVVAAPPQVIYLVPGQAPPPAREH